MIWHEGDDLIHGNDGSDILHGSSGNDRTCMVVKMLI